MTRHRCTPRGMCFAAYSLLKTNILILCFIAVAAGVQTAALTSNNTSCSASLPSLPMSLSVHPPAQGYFSFALLWEAACMPKYCCFPYREAYLQLPCDWADKQHHVILYFHVTPSRHCCLCSCRVGEPLRRHIDCSVA